MANFEKALVGLLRAEGGYVDDPNDRGGATNHGVTQATLAAWRGHPVTKDDVRALTAEEAGQIYRAWWWAPLRLDEVKDQRVAEIIFDHAVNTSAPQKPERAVQLAQRCCNFVAAGDALAVDGQMGAQTIAAINRSTPRVLALALTAMRVDYYRQVARPKNQRAFLYFWIHRTAGHIEDGLKWTWD